MVAKKQGIVVWVCIEETYPPVVVFEGWEYMI